jgi:acyl-homoserine-lactone acylase
VIARFLTSLTVVGHVLVATGSSQRQVTIYRDDWGVPHIYAPDQAAGYYALGYAMAEDELDYVLTLVLLARGEMAGAMGQEHVASDYASRLWRHAEEAKVGFGRMTPALQTNYRAYVAGLTRWMTEHPDKTPSWAPRVEPWDPVAISRWLLWLAYHAGEGLADCRRGGVKLAAADVAALEHRTTLASNEWVLAPWRTADNALMMLSDPHGGVDGQFVYEFRMHAGDLEMAGYTVGAMPLLIQTRRVAWGMTTGAPDVSDCYAIDVDPAKPRQFLFDGKPQRMTTATFTIPVKGAKPVVRVAEYTRHNGVLSPVVARTEGRAYVVSTPYMPDAGVFDDEVYRMALAPDAAGVREAMRTLGMFPQNVMVGDRAGHSFYVRAGKAPKRPTGFDWRNPVPGNSSRSAWLGVHPLEDLVQITDPATGYMQNNNISPDQMFPGSPLTPDRYPADVFNDTPGRTNSRARRAIEALSQAYRFTVDDAIALAVDDKWMDTDHWRLALIRSLARRPDKAAALSTAAKTLVDRIIRFDGHARVESVAALNFWYWRSALAIQPDGLPLEVVRPAFLAADTIRVALADRVLAAVDSAVATLTRLHGGIDRPFGDVFRVGRGGKSSWPVGGMGLTAGPLSRCEGLASWNHVCVMTLRAFIPGDPDSLGRRHAIVGSRLLRLTIFTDPIRSYTAHNYGQSGRPESPHYEDQAAKLTSAGKLKPVYFDKTELMPHVKSERTLDVPPL